MVRNSLLFPCWSSRRAAKVSRKPFSQKGLGRKFPGIPAPFPAYGPKSADFGQNLQNSVLQLKKFAAKFPAAGNCTDGSRAQKRHVCPGAGKAQQRLSALGRTRANLTRIALMDADQHRKIWGNSSVQNPRPKGLRYPRRVLVLVLTYVTQPERASPGANAALPGSRVCPCDSRV